MNILLLRGGTAYTEMFQRHEWNVLFGMGGIPEEESIDLICFTGGTDVNPALYKHNRHRYTSTSDIARDEMEMEIFQKAKKKGIPMVGICRGAQFLCVANGGTLYQHVSNHNAPHSMVTNDGKRFVVSSTHHQMMNPKGGQLVGWADALSSTYEGAAGKALPLPFRLREPEAVYWEDTKCFATQYHPEYFANDVPAVDFFFEYVERLMK